MILLGQGSSSSMLTAPASSAAAVVTVLNVDPGGNSPVSAIGPWLFALSFCATARTPPVLGLSTTRTAARCSLSTACFAALCSVVSRVVAIG